MIAHPGLPRRPGIARSSLPLSLGLLLATVWSATAAQDVEVLRVPGGGLQPQTVVTSDGTVHLMYLRGEEGKADVWYARRRRGEPDFGTPVRVNTQPGSAVAVGTIRGAQFAIDRQDRVHAVWNGSGQAKHHTGAPLWVTHQLANGGFAPELDVIRTTAHLDGGGSVALGKPGQVFAVWHSAPPDTDGETNRGVFLAVSNDSGVTFGEELRVDRPGDGVCACCGLRSLGREDGTLAILYRTASDNGDFRDMTLLLRGPEGGQPRRVVLDRWSLRSCPMSSSSMAWAGENLLATWETRDEVLLAEINVATGILQRIAPPPGAAKRKHPSIARNDRGEILLAWVEDTGWKRGGSVAWQHYDAKQQPTSTRGRREGVPVWGMASAFSVGDRFGILY